MAYDEGLAQRVREILEDIPGYNEKKMFGGICCLIDGNMACGVLGDDIIIRVGPEAYEGALEQDHTKIFDFTGRPMKGFVFVGQEGIDLEDDLAYWLQLCLDFNPQAKSSKKKRKAKP